MIVMRSYIEPGGLRGGPPGPASLVLAVSHSQEGWVAANCILAKLAKKAGENNLPANCSAFVSRAVLNARAEIPRGWGHR